MAQTIIKTVEMLKQGAQQSEQVTGKEVDLFGKKKNAIDVNILNQEITVGYVLQLANSPSFLSSENFDKVTFKTQDDGYALTYFLDNIAQFQVVFAITSYNEFFISKKDITAPLLTENDDVLLSESADNILAEGILPI